MYNLIKNVHKRLFIIAAQIILPLSQMEQYTTGASVC